MYHITSHSHRSPSHHLADKVSQRCFTFLAPLLKRLDRHLDSRLVNTLANSVTALIRHRQTPSALLLSELGAYLTSPEHAPAGTKRLANLVHSSHWQAENIDNFLLKQAHDRVKEEIYHRPGQRGLCIGDGSVVEKPESSRRRGGMEPWRLLTNEPVETEEECWRIAQAYASRWQVEQMLRYNKSELGIESVRIRKWEGRRKLLAIASLAYAFLVGMVGGTARGDIALGAPYGEAG